jgi:hypothetical protein
VGPSSPAAPRLKAQTQKQSAMRQSDDLSS